MDYKKIYDDIILKAQSENRKKGNGIYYENHHIIPRSLGGSDSKENLVLLTAKEHFVAHKLLVEIYPGNKSMIYTTYMMSISDNNGKRGYKVGAKEYERLKIIFIFISTGRKNSEDTILKMSESAKGKPKSKEHRENLSKANKGKESPNKGKVNKYHHTEEAKRKIGNSGKGRKASENLMKCMKENNPMKREDVKLKCAKSNTGQKRSEETCKRIGLTSLGRKFTEESKLKRKLTNLKLPILVCEFCGFESNNTGNMKQHHGDNCKLNPNRIPKIYLCEYCDFKTEFKNIIARFHNNNCKHKPQ